jgi:micrococcal nuclease
MEPWEYRAAVERVVEGDTLDLRIDLGFGVILTGDEAHVRLRDIDTTEIFGASKGSDEYAAGQRHKQFVEAWVSVYCNCLPVVRRPVPANHRQ